MAGLQKLSRSALRRDGAEQAGRMEAVRTTAERLLTREAYAAEVSRLWHEAQDRFVAIGEYLVHAKATLPHGEYEKMVAHDLPFGRAVAHALRTVAFAVSDGKIAKPELPRSYTTAYFLAALKPDHLALARDRGLLRADVPRSAVDAFRRELRSGFGDRHGKLSKERARLRKQMESILVRLAEIEADIGPDKDQNWSLTEGEVTEVSTRTIAP